MAARIHILASLLALFLAGGLAAQELPACVHAEESVLHFPGSREAQDRFYAKLDSLVATGRGNVNIWHVGGSHVQAAFFPNRSHSFRRLWYNGEWFHISFLVLPHRHLISGGFIWPYNSCAQASRAISSMIP